MPPHTVKVARPGVWGNPHKIGAGSTPTADEAVAAYERDLLNGKLVDRDGRPLRDRLGELAGKNLACFCALDAPCHADVLLRLANGSGR